MFGMVALSENDCLSVPFAFSYEGEYFICPYYFVSYTINTVCDIPNLQWFSLPFLTM